MPWKPGESGNPDGRPRRTSDLAKKISEKDDFHRLRLENIAANGNDKDATAAIKLLWAYAHGNPTTRVTGADDGPIQVAGVNLADVLANLAK